MTRSGRGVISGGGQGSNCLRPIKAQAKNNRPMQCKTANTCRHIIAVRLPCHCDVQTVCLHKYITTRPPIVPQFDVSFPEKLVKIVATRGEIFSLKFTKYRLAAGLRADPLGELKRSPDPLPVMRGPTSKGREGKVRRKRGEERLPHTCKTSFVSLQTVCLRGSMLSLGHQTPSLAIHFLKSS